MQIYYLLRLHRSGVVRQETGERVGYLLEMRRQNRKHKRSVSTVINSLWNDHSGGGTNRAGGSEVVRWLCKGEDNWNPTMAVEENTDELKPCITMVRRPCEDGDQ